MHDERDERDQPDRHQGEQDAHPGEIAPHLPLPSQFSSALPDVAASSDQARGPVEGAFPDAASHTHPPDPYQRPARRRRKLNVDIGTSITDFDGYLLRNRSGSDVPVGPTEALLLSEGFPPRDLALLKAAEQLGILTTEQAARAFFNSQRSAYKRLLTLAERRFLARIESDAAVVRFAVGHHNMNDGRPGKNPAYVLDWNGYYLLTAHHSYQVRNWRASTAAVVTSRFGHTVGISEIWSYLVAAARATQELDLAPEDPWRYRLSVGFLDERQSLLTTKRAAMAGAAGAAATAGGGKVLLQPDATLIVGIREFGPGRWPEAVSGVGTAVGTGTEAEVKLVGASGDLPAGMSRSTNPRWDPTLNSWDRALLPTVPPPDAMVASEKPGSLIYRSLLLEMETGSNNLKDSNSKVASYNRLIRTNGRAWHGAYGISPRVLVVVRTDDQVEAQASIWRTQYAIQDETSVLVASLQTLARTYSSGFNGGYSGGRRALIDQRCLFDVMAPPQSAWKSLGQALHIKTVVSRMQK